MGRTWVLETQTKGTGAQVVPLEDHQVKPSPPVPGFKLPPLKELDPDETPRGPLRFKLIDVVSRRVLADDVDVRGAVAAMAGVRSVVDVNAYTWDEDGERWRLLTLAETRALWEHRARSVKEAA